MARATITPGAGPFHFGETYSRDQLVGSWTPGSAGIDGYYARLDASQSGTVVGSGMVNLSGNTQLNITMGPSPAWQSGAATGVLTLVGFSNGKQRDVATSDEFSIEA